MTAERVIRWAAVMAAVGLATWSSVGSRNTAHDTADLAKRTGSSNVRNCARQNLLSGTVRVGARTQRAEETDLAYERRRLRAERLFPVANCPESLGRGHTVSLSPAESQMYTDLVDVGRLPVVRDARVIGWRTEFPDSGSFESPDSGPYHKLKETR